MKSSDLIEVFSNISEELQRLRWTEEVGRNYLLQTYGKRSRYLLTQEELLEFLEYLKSQTTPEVASQQLFELESSADVEMYHIQWTLLLSSTDVEMYRIQWTEEVGRNYLIQTYRKQSRYLLTQEELLDFLRYLKSQPTHPNRRIKLLEAEPVIRHSQAEPGNEARAERGLEG